MHRKTLITALIIMIMLCSMVVIVQNVYRAFAGKAYSLPCPAVRTTEELGFFLYYTERGSDASQPSFTGEDIPVKSWDISKIPYRFHVMLTQRFSYTDHFFFADRDGSIVMNMGSLNSQKGNVTITCYEAGTNFAVMSWTGVPQDVISLRWYPLDLGSLYYFSFEADSISLIGEGTVLAESVFLNAENDRFRYCKSGAFRKKLALSKEDLPEVSDLIVIATVLPEKTQHLSTFELGGQEYTGGGYTFTRLEIKKVLKGEPEADVITITEEYYTSVDDEGKHITTDGSYLPAKEGKEYIFFLKKYDDNSDRAGLYFPVDLEFGRYVVDDAEAETYKDYDLLDDSDFAVYKRWYYYVKGLYTEPKAYFITEAYVYPVTPRDEAWKAFNGSLEAREACQVPEVLLEAMTTDALVETVVKYPFFADVYAHKSVEDGFRHVSKNFKGIEILLRRSDAYECLSKYIASMVINDRFDSYEKMNCGTLLKYLDDPEGVHGNPGEALW